MSVEEDLKAISEGLDRRDAEIIRLHAEVAARDRVIEAAFAALGAYVCPNGQALTLEMKARRLRAELEVK